jgi:hypothetical protein
MERDARIKLSPAELNAMFADEKWSREFPPILLVEDAARLAGVEVATVYDWSSRGLLREFANKKGKKLRILRNKFVEFLFSR